MGNVIIIIDDVEYEAVQADSTNKCKNCYFYNECTDYECHCGFLGKVMDDKHFVRKRKGGIIPQSATIL